MVKLTDVAKLAGVSPTTVSRVINNYGSLSQKTIDKVHLAMKELNYQPNSLARSLQGKKTQLIGVIFPSVAIPFFGELVEKIEEKLFSLGYKTILCDSAKDPEKERKYINMLQANQVDGIIAGAHNLGIHEYENIGLPIVSFDRYLADGIPIVGSDNFQGGYEATKNLYLRGARKILNLTGTRTSNSPTNNRSKGYEAFMTEEKLPSVIVSLDTISSSTILRKMKIKELLLTHQPDAVFCTDDLTAILVYQQALEMNLKIPEDLKVIGYDGTNFIQSYFPQLATMVQPIEAFADLLVQLLLERIHEPKKEFQKNYVLPTTFKTGSSI